MIEKRAVVVVGITPSIESGRASELIKNGEAVCCDEQLPKELATSVRVGDSPPHEQVQR